MYFSSYLLKQTKGKIELQFKKKKNAKEIKFCIGLAKNFL